MNYPLRAAVIEFFLLNNHPDKTTYANAFLALCTAVLSLGKHWAQRPLPSGVRHPHQGCSGAVGDVSSQEPKPLE